MKKKFKFLPFLAITAMAVVGCSTKAIKVSGGDKNYLDVNGNKDIELETYQELFDTLFSENGNSTMQKWLIEKIIELEGINKDLSTADKNGRNSDIKKRLEKYKEEWLKNEAYYIDNVFAERKLVTSLKTIGYDITCPVVDGVTQYFTAPSKNVNPYSLGEPYSVSKESDFDDNDPSDDPTYKLTLHEDDDESKPIILKCNYQDYENKTAYPSIYQDLIKEQFIKDEQLKDLLGEDSSKRVREFRTFELAFDSSDSNVAIFVDKMNDAIASAKEEILPDITEIDFSVFTPGDASEPTHYTNLLATREDRLDFANYERVWKVYKHSLIAKEIEKMGYLGPLAEETEASKLATDEEKKNLVNKYSGNNTYSTLEGEWLANHNINKTEFTQTKVYTTESSPFNTSITNYAFNKNKNDDFREKIVDIGNQRFLESIINEGDYYQIDNTGSKYVFIEILNTFDDVFSGDDSIINQNLAAEAFLERSSVDALAFVHYFKKWNLIIGDKGFYDYIKANYPKFFED